MEKIFELIDRVNESMRSFGFNIDMAIGNDNINITRKEVIIKMPYTLKIAIPKEELAGTDSEISNAVSQAISRAVNVHK